IARKSPQACSCCSSSAMRAFSAASRALLVEPSMVLAAVIGAPGQNFRRVAIHTPNEGLRYVSRDTFLSDPKPSDEPSTGPSPPAFQRVASCSPFWPGVDYEGNAARILMRLGSPQSS